MTIPRTLGWGLALAAATATISGVSVFVNGLIVAEFPDPVALAAARNGLVGLVLMGLVLATGRSEVDRLRATPPRRLVGLAALGVIGGGIPFILFFTALPAAGGAGAAILHKTIFLWVAILAVPLLGERLGRIQLAALVALAVGIWLVGPAPALGQSGAVALIVAATWLWAAEVILARRLLPGTSVRLAAAARMLVGGAVIAGWLLLEGRAGAIAAFGAGQWLLIGATGLLLLGYVTTWYGALQRAPATAVSAILVGGGVVTALLGIVRAGALPPFEVALGLVILTAGVAALGLALRRRPGRPALGPVEEGGR